MTNQNQSGSGTQDQSSTGKDQTSVTDQVNPATGQKWKETDEGYQDFIESQNKDQESDTTGDQTGQSR